MKFDWQTDEDGPLVPESVETRRDTAHRYRWLIWLGLPAVLFLTGFAAYYQLNRRVDAAHLQVEADVLAAFSLAQQALAQGDAELLTAVLSPQDPQWLREWQAVADEGSYPHAISPLLVGHGEIEIVSVSLNDELNQAEIVWRRTYTFHGDNGRSETIRLERTDFYYKTVTGWLWVKPPDDFWGEWESWPGRYLTLYYPARDAATAVPLAEALEAHLDEWCRGELPAFMHCPHQPPWNMRLAVNPTALNRPHQYDYNQTATTGSWRFYPLPTPSLFGQPVDDAGRDALLRHYAWQMGLSLVRYSQMWPTQASSPDNLMQSVLWLAEAGLYPWPPPGLPPAPAALPADLVFHCANAAGGNLWRYRAAAGEWQPLLPELPVYEFAPWPGGDGFFIGTRVMHKEETWVELSRYWDDRLIPIRNFFNPRVEGSAASLNPIRDGRQMSLFVHEQPNRWQRYLLDSRQCDDYGCPLMPVSNSWSENWSPDGRHGIRIFDGILWLIAGGGAPLREIGRGSAVWLDDSRFAYFNQSVNPISGPTSPPVYRLDLMRVDRDAPEYTITLDELFAAHGLAAEYGQWFSFGGFLPNPHQPEQMIVATGGRYSLSGSPGLMRPSASALFLLTLDADAPNGLTTELLPMTITELINVPVFTSDGRRLILVGHAEGQTLIELIDPASSQSERVTVSVQPDFFEGLFVLYGFIQPNWSPDGRWLALMYEGVAHLVNVETAEHTAVVPPHPSCADLAWLRGAATNDGRLTTDN
jgi:hypothetical protein